jgi:hypothetical protein
MAVITDKQNIKNKLKLYKKNLKLDLDCPNGNVFLNNKLTTISKQNKLNVKDIKLAIGEYKTITEKTKICNQELVDKFNTIKSFIAEKQELANLTGKKLLIVLGESHHSQKSILFELMLITYLKTQDMNSLLVEFDNKELNAIINNNYSSELKTPAHFFAKDVLGYKLTAIDPLKKAFDLDDSPTESAYNLRADAINKAISVNHQQNQICIIGANHFKHIINSSIIIDKFVIAAIDVSTDIAKMPKEVLDTITDEAINNSKAIQEMAGNFRIDLSSSMESFSLGQMYEIYENNLDLLLAQGSQISTTQIYRSDFVEDTSICEGFDTKENIIKALGMFAHNDVHHHDL